MAVGDLWWFDEATPIGFPQSSAFSSGDTMSCVLITNVGITSTESTLSYTAYTEAATAGTYPASGTTLDTWGDMWTQLGKVATFDTTTNPTWAANASNSTAVTYALITNLTDTGKRAVCAVDLGSVDMTAGDLTITWNATGLATVTST
jgi:hypothetical protein